MGGKNRIVVNYGDRWELVLLTRIDTETGAEMYYDDLVSTYSKYFTVVKRLNLKTFADVMKYQKSNLNNEAGAVVRFLSGFRIKINFEEYVRLHVIMTNVSNLTVWEHLMNNYNFDELLDRVPDEFYDWLKKTTKIIQSDFNEIERQALKEFVRIYHINEIAERKLFAAEALKSEHCSILFRLYDKKSYNEIIWKEVRPVLITDYK